MSGFSRDYETLRVQVVDHVATVKLHRPEVLNAISMPMYANLVDAFTTLNDDSSVWIIIVTGEGRSFSVGADLKERQSMSVQEVRQRLRLAPRTFGAIANSNQPVIAAINGYAFGGGFELALACDLLVASETAQLSLPETTLGVIPGGGATQRLPRIIGLQRAKELILTGRRFSAQDAYQYGILNYVVPQTHLQERVQALVEEMKASSPLALIQAKRAINASVNVGLEAGLVFEAEAYQACLNSKDRDEGLAAFREKRNPIFTGE